MIKLLAEGAEEAAAGRGVDESGRTKPVVISVLTSMDEDALHSIGVDDLLRMSCSFGSSSYNAVPTELSALLRKHRR